jgi:predicted RND superfamily exporter protein
MRRYFTLIVAHPVAVLVLGTLLALALGAGILKLSRNTSPDAFIPERHPALVLKQTVESQFGLTEPIAVGVIRDAPGGVFTPHTLRRIRDLSQAIQQLPQIQPEDVISLATESGVYFEDGEPGFERLMKNIPSTAEGLEALRQDVMEYELYKGTLVAADGSAACILIRLREEQAAEEIYRSLRELLDRFTVEDEELVVAGEAVVRSHMGQAVSDDALRMNFISPVVMFLLIVLAYRTLRGTILPICVIGGASAAALGLMGWFNTPVYIVTNGIFVVIMALSVADSFHLLGQYYEEQLHPAGRSRQELVVAACMALWYPLLVTTLTDVAGFFALYLVGGMPPIRFFGLFTCVGVLAALIYSYTVVPAGLAVLPLKMSQAFAKRKQTGSLDLVGTTMFALGGWVYRNRRFVLIAGLGLILVCLWGASKLIVNDARILAFKDHHPLVRATHALNERFDGTSSLNIVITASEKEALLQPEVLRKIEALEAYTESLPHVGGTHSPAGWIKRAHQKLHKEDPDYYDIPEDPEDTRFYLDSLYIETCPMAHLLREVIDQSYTTANLIVRMRSSEYLHQKEVISALETYLAQAFPDPSLQAALAGRVHLDYHWLRMVRTSHLLGAAFSTAACLLLTSLMFRSLVAGLLCTLTVGLVVLVDYAVMGLAGIPLGVGTSMFASIAIGAGVNFPIHILDRLRISLRVPEANIENIYATTMAFTGRALFFAAFVVAVGFLLLCTSEFRTLIEFGLLIGLGMVASFVVSVTLLPALVAVLRPRFVRGQPK